MKKNKIFLLRKEQTVVRVYDLNQGKTAEFQRINNKWFLIEEFSNKPFTQKAFYRFLFHCQYFAPKKKKYSIALDRSQALPLVQKGYKLLDENLNAYRYDGKRYFKNNDELSDLPLAPNYIVMPFQDRIRDDEPVVTDNAHFVRSKDYNPERKPNRPLLDSSELKIAKYKIKTEEAEKTVVKLQQQLSTESKKKVKYAIGSSILGFVAGFVSDRCMKKFFSVDELYSYKYF